MSYGLTKGNTVCFLRTEKLFSKNSDANIQIYFE